MLNISVASKMNEIFNGCFAFLMFFVLVFFLIYGVEIFYKVKGAFKHSSTNTAVVVAHGDSVGDKHVNVGQLFQSRMGLSVQAGVYNDYVTLILSDLISMPITIALLIIYHHTYNICFPYYELTW